MGPPLFLSANETLCRTGATVTVKCTGAATDDKALDFDEWARKAGFDEQLINLVRVAELNTFLSSRAEMQIIAFITEAVPVRAMLEHIGEPATYAPYRPSAGSAGVIRGRHGAHASAAEAGSAGDPCAQPAPEHKYDQRVSW